MRLALAQINSVVGDVDGNAARIVEWLGEAQGAGPTWCSSPSSS